MDPQDPENSSTPTEGNRPPPPPPRMPGSGAGPAQGAPQSETHQSGSEPTSGGSYSAPHTPPGGSPQYQPPTAPPQVQYPTQPPQYGPGSQPQPQQPSPYQTQSQPPWPPYPQQNQGQGDYPQGQGQSYPPQAPYNPPPPGSYAPGSPGPQQHGGYPQPDYRPTAQGGYNIQDSHNQPTQAYGQQQGQGTYGGYQGQPGQPGQPGYQGYPPGYPPQQGGTGQYNINTSKKGTPAWVWGAIGLVAIALIGAGSYFLFLAPKSSNNAVVAATAQHTTVTNQPTPAPGQPTTDPRQPTTGPVSPTRSQGRTPVRPSATRLPAEPTRVPLGTATVSGQGGGFEGALRDAVNTFLGYLRSGDYNAAQAMMAPEFAQAIDATQLQTLWEALQSGMSGGEIQVGDARESGNTADVDITIPFLGGFNQKATTQLRKQAGKWYITIPFNITGENIEVPTFAPFEQTPGIFELPEETPVLP